MPGSLAHESELEFELGGPAYRLMQRVRLIKGGGPSIGRRSVGFLLITWVPLLVFSLIEGRALGPTPRESFLLDLATYARFFLAVPLLFVFGMIREMKPVPFSRQLILQIAVLACLPGLPLVFLVMPVGELLKLLAGALL